MNNIAGKRALKKMNDSTRNRLYMSTAKTNQYKSSNSRISPSEGSRYGNTTAPRNGAKVESAHMKFKTYRLSQKRRARRKK